MVVEEPDTQGTMANNTDLTNKLLTADKPLFAAAADAAVVTLYYLTF